MEGWLNPEDRLDILRRVDQERRWWSLDDKRICLVCERVFTGRQVDIEKHGNKYILHCPTTNCPSDHTRWLARGVPMAEATSTPESSGQRSFSFLVDETAQLEPSETG
jgi:hypothetical protein